MGSRKRVAKDYDRFQDIAGQLRQQMEEFSAVLKANQIGEVDISSVRGQARTVADKLTRFRVDARTNLNQAKSIASRIHPDHRNDYTGKVQQAETMVAEVESAAQRMLDSIEHFLTLTEGRTKLWVGPQTDYYHAFTRAMGQQSELNGSLAQLNNLFAQIQSIIKAQ
jgi:cell division septum initiation protein DivIVA